MHDFQGAFDVLDISERLKWGANASVETEDSVFDIGS